jgi:NitT/TauT family transport system ATP-binding protein
MPLRITAVCKAYRETNQHTIVFDGFDLTVDDHQFVSLVGPCGSGKTTLLRLISGLDLPDAGRITFTNPSGDSFISTQNGQNLVAIATLVFQEYDRSLLPWQTPEQALHWAYTGPSAQRLSTVNQLLEIMQLPKGHLPSQLSGGQRQQLAVTRALARQPRILLMDEPFGSVDPLARADLEQFLLRTWHAADMPMVLFVTHDIDEAVLLGQRVVVLGRHPARVMDDLQVPFGTERNRAITDTQAFIQIRRRVRAKIADAARGTSQ